MVGVGFERQVVARLPLGEAERAGSDRLSRESLGRLGQRPWRQHPQAGQLGEQWGNGWRVTTMAVRGPAILDPLDRAKLGSDRQTRPIEHPFDSSADAAGVERLAVMEGNARAELELPAPVVERSVCLGQSRLDGAVVAQCQQPVEDVAVDTGLDQASLLERVQAGGVGPQRDACHAAVCPAVPLAGRQPASVGAQRGAQERLEKGPAGEPRVRAVRGRGRSRRSQRPRALTASGRPGRGGADCSARGCGAGARRAPRRPSPSAATPSRRAAPVGEAVAVDLAHHPLWRALAERELAQLERQWRRSTSQLGAFESGLLAPAHPAVVHGLEAVVQLADAAVHVQHVEAVVRPRAGRRLAEHQVAGAALELLAEALEERIVELPHLDAVEQLVADPVGLDHPRSNGSAMPLARAISCR